MSGGEIRDAFPSPQDFLVALERFWGRKGYRPSSKYPGKFYGACPACDADRAAGETDRGPFTLVIYEADDGYVVTATCGCSDIAIIAGLERGARLRLRPLDSVRARRVRWAWRGLVPLGKVTVLAGPPGLGKSLLTALFAAAVSRGVAPGDLEGSPADVLIGSAEDDPEDTIKPRAVAAGADDQRVVMTDLRPMNDAGNPIAGIIQLPGSVPDIAKAVSRTGAKLVVLDPVVAFLDGGHSAYKEQDVRAALAPLVRMAEETGCAVVLVMHLNKAEGTDALRRIGNSGAFTALARSVLLLGPDPEDEEGDLRILAPVKGNLASHIGPVGLRLRVESRQVAGADDDPIDTAAIVPIEAVAVEPEDLLADRDGRSALADAMAFLRESLGDGPKLAREVKRAAEDGGHSRTTLKRAKLALRVRSHKRGGENGPWMWALPSDESSDDSDDHRPGKGPLGPLPAPTGHDDGLLPEEAHDTEPERPNKVKESNPANGDREDPRDQPLGEQGVADYLCDNLGGEILDNDRARR